MTRNIGVDSRRNPSRIATAFAISACILLGGIASANAEGRGDDHRGGYHRDRGYHGWGGNYYSAPPVVYGAPYYAPGYYAPPVVYGGGVGIYTPGLSIGIR